MTTLLFIACLAAVAVGAGLIYLPAGLITGGALGAWTLIRAEQATPPAPEGT